MPPGPSSVCAGAGCRRRPERAAIARSPPGHSDQRLQIDWTAGPSGRIESPLFGHAVDGRTSSHPLPDRSCDSLPVGGNPGLSRHHCQWTPPDRLRMTGALPDEVYRDLETPRATVSEGLLGCQGGIPSTDSLGPAWYLSIGDARSPPWPIVQARETSDGFVAVTGSGTGKKRENVPVASGDLRQPAFAVEPARSWSIIRPANDHSFRLREPPPTGKNTPMISGFGLTDLNPFRQGV